MTKQTFRVGALEITRIVELEIPLGPALLPIGRDPAALVEAAGWAKPHFVTESGEIVFALSATCFVSEGLTIVVDPCMSFDLRRGNADIADRAASFFEDLLPAAGVQPDRVDLVLNTHVDGVGWNVRPGKGSWRPAFPNARNVWTEVEMERVLGGRGGVPSAEGDASSLAPLLEADRIDRVSMSHRVTGEVSFRPSPGHTSGNVDIWIESEGDAAVIVGDDVLNPIQCADPDWAGLDGDPEASPALRRALLASCCESGALMIGGHFGSPGAGRVRAAADGSPGEGPWWLQAEAPS